MPSAICFNLDQSKSLSSGNGLTLYNIMTSLNTSEGKKLLKTFWEKEKLVVTLKVLYPMKDINDLMFCVAFNLSSANIYNLGEVKTLSGKGL